MTRFAHFRRRLSDFLPHHSIEHRWWIFSLLLCIQAGSKAREAAVVQTELLSLRDEVVIREHALRIRDQKLQQYLTMVCQS